MKPPERERPPLNPLPTSPQEPGRLRHCRAATASGTEEVAAREIEALGGREVRVHRGTVSFDADLETFYLCHRLVRTVTRITLPIREFAVLHAPMLYDQIHRMRWEELIRPEQTLAVDCTLPQSEEENSEHARRDPRARPRPPVNGLHHSHFAALKIKDAIVDRIREKRGSRPSIDTKNPDFRVIAHISRENRCLLSLDATGASLHERGYRSPGAEAPLKETLAASIVALTGWEADRPLIDPMCGSGTLVIEAALRAIRAPLSNRSRRHAFMSWPDYDPKLWESATKKADSLRREKLEAPILAYDSSAKAIAQAKRNAGLAGVEKYIHFERRDLQAMEKQPQASGVLVTNPPYGERIGGHGDLEALYEKLGEVLKHRLPGWTAYILSGNPELSRFIGLKSSRKHPLRNGALSCRLLRYDIH